VIGLLIDAFKGSFVGAFCYLILFAVILIAAFLVLKPLEAKKPATT
jgi:hypothetical protein